MAYNVFALFSIILVILVVGGSAQSNATCNLAGHLRNQTDWNINPPQNIYGNATVGNSLAWTWGGSTSVEKKINQQINAELFAHYNYVSMAAHFDRDDIMLPGFAKFFRESAEEEHKHALLFMEYLNRRGGRVKLNPIMAPCHDQWGNGRMAMVEALKLEKEINQHLIDLHNVAEAISDYQIMDFIESNFLNEQIESIKQLANYINTLNRLGDGGLGEYQFDKITLGK